MERLIMERTILHIDMNAYFAAIEERCNPYLQGKPIVISGSPETRTTVATANYKAREYGIESGMPLKQALGLCPQAEVVVGNPAKYVDTTSRLLEIFTEFTPLVECYSIDEVFLDVTRTRHLFGGEMKIAEKIKKRIKEKLGLTCSIGIASNKLMAKFASGQEKPDGLVRIEEGEIPRILKDLPVDKLCGIGEKLRMKLNALGIKTCGELGEYPEEKLVGVFGIWGHILHCMGKGLDASPVIPSGPENLVKSMGHSYTLYRDTSDPALVKATLYRLCEQVGERLRKGGYRGRTVALVLRFSDFHTITRQKTIDEHIDDGYRIYEVALDVMRTIRIRKAVRLVGMSVSNLSRNVYQLPLFEKEKRRRRLLACLDRINDKFGKFTVTPGSLLVEKFLSRRDRGKNFVTGCMNPDGRKEKWI